MSLKTIFCPPNADNCRKFIFGLDDLAGASAIGGLFSAGSGLIGGLFSSGEGRAQRKWATQENALNRQFQHDEAELAYNRNEHTRIAQNKWNSEQAQVARMKEAGINPYNAIGGLSGSSVSSSGNTASAGNAAGSQMMYQQAKMDWVNNIAQAGLMAAQARKLDAETKNLNSGTKGQDLQNKYDEFRNDLQEKFGEDILKAELGLKRAGWNAADSQASLNDSIRHLNSYDLIAMRPVERAETISRIVVNNVLPSYYQSAAFKNNTDANLAGKMFGYQVASLMAGVYRDNAMARSYNADVPLKAQLGSMYGKMGGFYDAQSRLADAGVLEANSRTSLNKLNYDRGYISYMQEKDYYDKVWNLQMDAFRQSFAAQIAHDQMRNSEVVGSFTAGFFNTLDELKGFVGFGFGSYNSNSNSVSHSTFQGTTTSHSTSESHNTNFNHNYSHKNPY